jgi:hypothetical protein
MNRATSRSANQDFQRKWSGTENAPDVFLMDGANSIEQPARSLFSFGLIRYLAELKSGKVVLWCYLIWYITMVAIYFDARPRIWLSSLGISVLVGVALILSTTGSWREVCCVNRWQLLRLFIMPFCVSSFSALIKERGFVLFFSPLWREDALAGGFCVLFCALVYGVKILSRNYSARTAPIT